MKKVFKWLGIIVLLLVMLIVGGISYVNYALPNVGDAKDIKIQATPERIARGEYLATSVAVCMDCHSTRDWTKFSGPITPGTLGRGGDAFDKNLGFPGNFYAANITPHALKDWTDGELFRAITTGVKKDGSAIFPVMPYHYYGLSDTDDIYSIIAYIRTLPEQANDVFESKPDFPFSIIMHTIPHKGTSHSKPSQSDSVAYGGYLVTMAACVECHTKVDDKMKLVAGTEFGGGREFNLPAGTLRTPNITMHASGIGAWDRQTFISRFKTYSDSNYHSPELAMTDFNTIMPWTMYGRMTEADLSSIYQYLKTIKPIDNKVEKFTPKPHKVAAK
ncbi:MAG: cytochrome C [Sphingobacteriales bacterium]|nr:MAG: cytochrome C [Sphingobacteriales bacterium]